VTLALGLTLFLAAAGAWQRAAPGVETLAFEEDGAAVSLIRFDLQRFRPEVVMLGPDRTKTASQLRRDLSAVAAINGGFFDEDRRSLGLRIAGGKTAVPLRRGVDWGVLVLRPGRAAIVHSRDFKADARIEGAIQVGPRLIAGGHRISRSISLGLENATNDTTQVTARMIRVTGIEAPSGVRPACSHDKRRRSGETSVISGARANVARNQDSTTMSAYSGCACT